jgi:hypothetical protein
MGRGKEVKLDLPFEYNVVSGTVDNKNPKSIYIQISAWGKPIEYVESSYESILKQKAKGIKKQLYNVVKEDFFYKKKSIVDFNMASSGIRKDKRSYMSVELTLFKKEPLLPLTSKDLLDEVGYISENLITGFFERDKDFKFFKTKN